jgi:hypothetical protein
MFPIFDRNQINLESHQLIWLDINVHRTESTDLTILTVKDLRQIVDYTKQFDNPEDCEEYLINKGSSYSTFFIGSGQIDQKIIEKFNKFPNLHKMYIFSKHIEDHNQVRRRL